MKNTLTVSDLTNLEDGTLCPTKLHKKLDILRPAYEPNFAAIEKTDVTTPKQHGTVLHAIIQFKLAHPYSTYRYKHPDIAAEADMYINWAKAQGYVNRKTEIEQPITTRFEDEYIKMKQKQNKEETFKTKTRAEIVDNVKHDPLTEYVITEACERILKSEFEAEPEDVYNNFVVGELGLNLSIEDTQYIINIMHWMYGVPDGLWEAAIKSGAIKL